MLTQKSKIIFSTMWQSDENQFQTKLSAVLRSVDFMFCELQLLVSNCWDFVWRTFVRKSTIQTASERLQVCEFVFTSSAIRVSRIYFFKFDLNVIIMTKLDVFMLYVNPFIQTVPCSSSEFLSQAKSCTKSGSAKLPELTSYECDRILNQKLQNYKYHILN